MKNAILCLICISFATSVLMTGCNIEKNKMKAPRATKISKELTEHNDTRIDNYFWLNDRSNPDVIAYLEQENAYTKEKMKDVEVLQKDLYSEIIGRIKQDDQSVPYFDNGYYYYTRFEEGKEYPLFCRKKQSLDSPEEVMLNINELAKGHDFYQVSGLSISPNNNLLAFGIDTVSRRQYTIHFKNLTTGELFDIKIPNTTGSVAWAADNKTVFYTSQNETTLRNDKIYKHKLGNPLSSVEEIYHEKDETFGTMVFQTKSEKYIIITSYSTLSNEYRFLDAKNPTGDFTIIQPRVRGLEYSIDHYGNNFYIVTNLNALNFRLMKTSVAHPGMENWIEVIPHRQDVYLENIEIFKDYLVIAERKDGLTNLRVKKWTSDEEYFIPMPEEVYTTGIGTNPNFDSKWVRFGYTSLTTPVSTFDYNMETHEKKLLKQAEVIGNFNPDNYKARRIYATAPDGERIPISLVYRKSTKIDGNSPALLYGYGSYGHTIDPGFSSTRLSLLDRGFVFAIAHIRGGQIYGRHWYDEGKLLKKKNTFTDFIACAEELVNQKFTSSKHLYAMGGSAGGLLMGAIVNLRPELFHGVIAAVPFVDVVTTMLDESIPLTTGEFDEWGNPKDSVYYHYMKEYSPYDNVKAQAYPNLLVTTGLHDSQVQYWEPAKWVAKLRELKTDKNLLLLKTNMETGHSGASGRFEKFKDTALEYSFLLKLEGYIDNR